MNHHKFKVVDRFPMDLDVVHANTLLQRIFARVELRWSKLFLDTLAYYI